MMREGAIRGSVQLSRTRCLLQFGELFQKQLVQDAQIIEFCQRLVCATQCLELEQPRCQRQRLLVQQHNGLPSWL